MENRRIARSALSIGAVTFTSRVFGLIREWLRGYLLGTTGSSDAFSIAFLFPNLMRRLVGEGALVAAFVPVFSDYLEKGSEDELRYFVHSFFTLLLFFLLACVIGAVALAPLLRYFLPKFAAVPGKMEHSAGDGCEREEPRGRATSARFGALTAVLPLWRATSCASAARPTPAFAAGRSPIPFRLRRPRR